MSPERLNRVTISLSGGDVVIPWASRDALLTKLVHLESMWPVVAAFRAVGATRPMTLTRSQTLGVLDLIDEWAEDVGVDDLPEGVWRLRVSLSEDVAAQG